jgi:hypothetical protein
LQFFRLKPYKTAFFRGACLKTEKEPAPMLEASPPTFGECQPALGACQPMLGASPPALREPADIL